MRRLHLAVLLLPVAAPNAWQKFLDGTTTAAKMKCGALPWSPHHQIASNASASTCGAGSAGIVEFYSHVCKQRVVSDKVAQHNYHTLYGIFLMPLVAAPKPKLLEIGLGCDMHEVGGSATTWKTLMPHGEIWLAEYDADCVRAMQQKGKLHGVNMLTGDQSSPQVLRRWMAESGGGFDAIIDDGGHANAMILTSFAVLWPHVKPGGFYFMEDLSAGRNPGWPQKTVKDRTTVVSDVIQNWIEALLIHPPNFRRLKPLGPGMAAAAAGPRHSSDMNGAPSLNVHDVPPDVEFITCQREMCVIAKSARPAPLPPIG